LPAGISPPEPVFLLINVAQSFKPSADSELISRLRAGEERAVSDLVRAHGARVYQMAFRYLKNAEDAEELTQDVLFKAVDKIREFRGDSALSSWLYRITFNAAMSRLRHLRGARAAEVPADSAAGESDGETWTTDVPDRQALADEELLRAELRERLADAVRALPAIYRAPVVLRDLHGLSTEEASSLLRLNLQTLKSRLHRGRLLLRRELADFSTGLTLHRATS
jgi:RNA polymerase sigma-70 factor (ECF subfamily)